MSRDNENVNEIEWNHIAIEDASMQECKDARMQGCKDVAVDKISEQQSINKCTIAKWSHMSPQVI
jgi:hypothetical protein